MSELAQIASAPPSADSRLRDRYRNRLLAIGARSWRRSKDRGLPAQPRLAHTLGRAGVTILAPVFDGLCRAFELTLARPIRTGTGRTTTADERLLCRMLAGKVLPSCLGCRSEAATLLDCAICSARVMLALAIPGRHEPATDG